MAKFLVEFECRKGNWCAGCTSCCDDLEFSQVVEAVSQEAAAGLAHQSEFVIVGVHPQ